MPRHREHWEHSPNRRTVRTNAEADAKFAADKTDYEKKLAEQKKQVDDYKRAEDEVARKKQEMKLAAEQAAADYQGATRGPRRNRPQPAARTSGSCQAGRRAQRRLPRLLGSRLRHRSPQRDAGRRHVVNDPLQGSDDRAR